MALRHAQLAFSMAGIKGRDLKDFEYPRTEEDAIRFLEWDKEQKRIRTEKVVENRDNSIMLVRDILSRDDLTDQVRERISNILREMESL